MLFTYWRWGRRWGDNVCHVFVGLGSQAPFGQWKLWRRADQRKMSEKQLSQSTQGERGSAGKLLLRQVFKQGWTGALQLRSTSQPEELVPLSLLFASAAGRAPAQGLTNALV